MLNFLPGDTSGGGVMMSKGIGILVVFLLTLAIGVASQVQARTLQEEMQLKMLHMQDILSGIAMEDYARVEKGADGLLNVCEAVGWTEEKAKGKFKTHDVEFHEVAGELLALAQAKNLEGVHYKYIEMTTICMNCHTHVRDIEKGEKYKEAHKYEPIKEGKHIHSR